MFLYLFYDALSHPSTMYIYILRRVPIYDITSMDSGPHYPNKLGLDLKACPTAG
jgi:hypothetical protein